MSIRRELVKNKKKTVIHPHRALPGSHKTLYSIRTECVFSMLKKKKIRVHVQLIPFMQNCAYMETGPNW